MIGSNIVVSISSDVLAIWADAAPTGIAVMLEALNKIADEYDVRDLFVIKKEH